MEAVRVEGRTVFKEVRDPISMLLIILVLALIAIHWYGEVDERLWRI